MELKVEGGGLLVSNVFGNLNSGRVSIGKPIFLYIKTL